MIDTLNSWVGLIISLLGFGGLFFAWHRNKVSKEKEYEHDQKNNDIAHTHFQSEIEDIKETEKSHTEKIHVLLDQKAARDHANEILLNRIDERIKNLQATISRMPGSSEEPS